MKPHLLLFLVSFLLSACSSTALTLNKKVTNVGDLAYKAVTTDPTQDDMTIILTFSGGGTRAAAFSYGVLKALHATTIREQGQSTNLLAKVDVISSVSGGSFTAAYYGLYGERIFKDYEQAFLKRPIQRTLIKHWLLNPSGWLRMVSSVYNRSDLAADYFESTVFGNKTFADLRDSPSIVINATDLGSGAVFSFTPENFRWICSDLNSYSVGKAVAASSAVPVLFSPIALKNHAGCQLFPYQHQQKIVGLQKNQPHSAMQGLSHYTDKKRFPYLHLVDGGVSDNLGVRPILRLIEQHGGFWKALQVYGRSQTRTVLFIVVNASDSISPVIASSPKQPKTDLTLNAVTTIQSSRYNKETLGLLQKNFSLWKQQVDEGRCAEAKHPDCDKINFHLVELNFQQLSKQQAQDLSLIETSLQLPDHKVDALIKAGVQLLQQSPQFQQAVWEIQNQQR